MKGGLFTLGLALVSSLTAAELTPETLRAWDRYVQSADDAMRARLQPGHTFLWIDEAPGRRRQLRDGEILVTSVGEHSPKKVPSGLIHHWMGAIFFPNSHVDDVLRVVRDYAHYKDYYKPSVLDSRALAQTPAADRFSMLVMNKSLLLKVALDSEYTTSYECVGRNRWFSTATAVQLREINDYGQPGQRELPPGEGSGYIWRLHNISRYEEADGGVYVEMEVIALSRDIPAMVRWMVDPIVRRVSKGAVVTSLRQTLNAVSSEGQSVAASPHGMDSRFLRPSPRP